MKVFLVVVENDGETTREPGMVSTEIKRMDIRYSAESIEQVWNAIEWLRNDPERTIMAIVEESPSITVLS